MAVYGERKKAKSAKKRLHFTQNCAILFSGSNAPLAQMDRAQASDAWCRRFESAMVRQTKNIPCWGCFLFRTMGREPSARCNATLPLHANQSHNGYLPPALA